MMIQQFFHSSLLLHHLSFPRSKTPRGIAEETVRLARFFSTRSVLSSVIPIHSLLCKDSYVAVSYTDQSLSNFTWRRGAEHKLVEAGLVLGSASSIWTVKGATHVVGVLAPVKDVRHGSYCSYIPRFDSVSDNDSSSHYWRNAQQQPQTEQPHRRRLP